MAVCTLILTFAICYFVKANVLHLEEKIGNSNPFNCRVIYNIETKYKFDKLDTVYYSNRCNAVSTTDDKLLATTTATSKKPGELWKSSKKM